MARRHVFRTWDDCFIPGTTVLRNKLTQPDKPYGETDPAKLQRLEEGAAAIRLVELAEHSIEGRFDDEHMKAIHRYIWGELNVIHSFPEGNTRSQFVFFSQLAEQAGWRLDPSRFAPGTPGRDEFVAARFYSQATGHNGRLAAVLGRAIVPL